MTAMPQKRSDASLLIGIFVALVVVIGATVFLVNWFDVAPSETTNQTESAAAQTEDSGGYN